MRLDPDLLPQGLPAEWVPGEGLHLGGMIVGEAPSRTEWEKKSPFVGTSGQFLRKELRAAGIFSEDMYITNIVKIWPRDDEGNTRPPSRAEIDAALPYLKEEIQHVVPKYILALGASTFRTLVGTELGLSLYRGFWQRLDEKFDWEEALVLPTYDPAFILRPEGRRLIDIWRRDLTEFATTWLKGVRK